MRDLRGYGYTVGLRRAEHGAEHGAEPNDAQPDALMAANEPDTLFDWSYPDSVDFRAER